MTKKPQKKQHTFTGGQQGQKHHDGADNDSVAYHFAF